MIIPTYRQWDLLQACLDALARQTLPQDQFEIVIVNNDPDDQHPDTLRMPPNARIETEAAKGSYAARNRGLAVARGSVVCFTDADCIPDPVWLAETLACLDQMPPVDRVGGDIVVTAPADGQDLWMLHERIFGFNQQRYVRRGGWAATANMSSRRSVFDKVGPFDAALYSGGDHEWGSRAAKEGHSIRFCAKALVFHPARESAALITRTRRIAGGAALLEIRSKGLSVCRRNFILSLPSRFFLPLSQLRKIVAEPALALGTRWQLFKLCYRLRWVGTAERFRLYFRQAEPERQ